MPWGGSEVLWQLAAKKLQSQNHEVTVNYKWWKHKAHQLKQLEERGGTVWLREQPQKPKKQFLKRKLQAAKSLFSGPSKPKQWLESERPDAVLITLGYHPDRIEIADKCIEMGIPYAINVQCASSFVFIPGQKIDEYRRWYKNAERVFFVSAENQLKLQNNTAMKFENAEIIANPFNVPIDADPEWPSTEETFNVALVGRIHFQSKGHDLVVDALKQPKWRNRNIKVSFYGDNQGNKKQLEELIQLHHLQKQLVIQEFKRDVQDIWRENHALLLPSRYEGAPLVVIEAMMCQRIAISTDIGRNSELIDDNESGFIAASATVDLVDDALERAWQKREQWQAMGKLAGRQIRERYPTDPVAEFADKITGLLKRSATN